MRFDSKELTRLAQAAPDKFVKEGCLSMKNKQDGLFKNAEVWTERWCRLRGNLLFYFKNKNPTGDVMGVLLMERYTVQLEIDNSTQFSFSIVFEGEDRPYVFAAESEKERDSWIQSLHVASYECMKIQVDSLREQIRSRSGSDPLMTGVDNDESNESNLSRHVSICEDNAVEIGISCSALPLDSSEQPPNPLVIISTITPPEQTWSPISQTEIVDRSTEPQFLTTVGLGGLEGMDATMRVKLVVYNVKERMTGTMVEIGQVIFTMSDILRATSSKLQLRLNSQDYGVAGIITIMSWPNSFNNSSQPREECVRSDSVIRSKPNRLDMLRCFCDNVFIKSFRFDTLHGHKLSVYEYMGESKLCYHLPLSLLKIWVDRERRLIDNLQDLGELNTNWIACKQTMLQYHTNSLSLYNSRVDFLHNFAGPSFKASVKKGNKDLEFVPINLHLQRMTVDNESNNESGGYDTVTSGAFSAMPHKFRDGGLHRMIKKLYESHADTSSLSGQAKMEKAAELLHSVYSTKSEACRACDALGDAVRATTLSSKSISAAMETLQFRVRHLIDIYDDPLLSETYKLYVRCRPHSERPSSPPPRLSTASHPAAGTSVKFANVEPWELSCINTDASLLCVRTMVDDLLTNIGTDRQSVKPSDICHTIIKLKSFLSALVKRAVSALTFLTLADHRDNIPLLHAIRYRRDVVFSHALTTFATGFVSKIRTSIHDDEFLRQLTTIGVLGVFESLLTCHAEELGMMEDMCVGINDLRHVTFRLIHALSDRHVLPEVLPNKFSVTVQVPIPSAMFELLPRELREGHLIKVVPVLFNIGINEQVLLAETLGDLSLQEEINIKSAEELSSYFVHYRDTISDPDVGKQIAETVDNLSKQLLYNVATKQSKNTEVLHLASEICRKLNGLRFTSCKSGKDRTSMSVTLEQVRLLQRHHSLASHLFNHALDCFRSEGVRRENAMKNVGVRKYAFTSLQLPLFPKLYRPPNGTYGNIQT